MDLEFEALVLPHLDAAYTLARYLTRNEADAQDIVQDASLRALKYFGGFRGTSSGEARAWFLAIVRNAAYGWRAREGNTSRVTEFDEELHSDTDSPSDAGMAVDVGRALARLPLEYREVIVLRELQGLSYKEISAVAGVPIGTVMSRLARARKRLQEALS